MYIRAITTFFFLIFGSIYCIWDLVAATPKVSITHENTKIETSHRIRTMQNILYSTAMKFDYSKLAVVIDGLQKEPRGRMQNTKISLSPYVTRDTEFTKLFIHELAHYIDIYTFVSRWEYDISDDFYYISWKTPQVKRANQGTLDFVSGYAASNQYEDFAESFVFYIFHNDTFADRALRSDSLRQKYLFLSEKVFPKGSFQWTDFTIWKIPAYVWDTTKISYSLQKYLYSL